MEAANNSVVLTSVFMALEGAFAYSAFLPSIMTIGTFVDSEAKIAMIRRGELVGSLFLLGLSIITAYIMRSPLPFLFGVAAGGITLAVYEHSLRYSPAWQERNMGE